MLGNAPLERLDLDEGRARAELAEFLARAEGYGRRRARASSMVVLAGAPRAVHVFLTGPSEGRVDRVAAREGVARDEARRRGGRA